MRVKHKLILAVALFTALCVLFTFSIGAVRSQIVNPSDYLIALNMRLYYDNELVYDEDSSSGINLYETSLVSNSTVNGFTINNYYSMQMPGTSSSPENINYNSGIADIYKFWGNSSLLEPGYSSIDEETKEFLEKDILISKVTCWFTFGFSSSPTSYPLIPIQLENNNIDFYLYFGGSILDDDSLIKYHYYYLPNTSHRLDSISGRYYDYRAFQVEFSFPTPIAPTSSNPYDYCVVTSVPFSLDNNGYQDLYALVGCDEVVVEYFNRSEYESGIINSNVQTVYNSKNELNNLTQSLAVQKPSDSVVNNLLTDIPISDVTIFSDKSKFDSSEFPLYNSLITTLVVASVSIAFIGYALHGKR